jgi:hypothetical protein
MTLHACISSITIVVILIVLVLSILGCLLGRQLCLSLLIEVVDVLSSQPCLLIFKLVFVVVRIHGNVLDLEFVCLSR